MERKASIFISAFAKVFYLATEIKFSSPFRHKYYKKKGRELPPGLYLKR